MEVAKFLKKHNACSGGYEWAVKNCATMQEVWDTVERGDWMAWLAIQDGVLTDRELRLFACFCARQNWHLLDECSKNAIITAEKYADGLVSKEELAAARAASAADKWAEGNAAAAWAAWAAADAADAADAASAARAASAASAAASDAASATAERAAAADAVRGAQMKWLRENCKPNFNI